MIDETHHLMPSSWHPVSLTLPQQLQGLIQITVHPGSVSTALLEAVDLVLAVGGSPEQTIAEFCEAVEESCPPMEPTELEPLEVMAWWRRSGEPPVRIRCMPQRTERRRHSRKYAEGNLGPDRSFHFRGPEGKLNLRAQNLNLFLQLADGVDDETWLHHLRQGDYSQWFRSKIKDTDLAAEAEEVEKRSDLSPQDTRTAIREAVERRYTLPAEPAEYVEREGLTGVGRVSARRGSSWGHQVLTSGLADPGSATRDTQPSTSTSTTSWRSFERKQAAVGPAA